LSVRGGPQVIPRPQTARAGEPAPWSRLPPDERCVTVDGLVEVFTGRVGSPSDIEGDPTAKGSAVLACVWEHEGAVELLLTRRAGHLRAHRGEVSFPGGRREPGETPVEAALREAYEEVGLDPTTVRVLGELDHLRTITSGSFIVPFVGVLPERPSYIRPNPDEVETVLFTPFDELVLDEVFREERWSWTGGTVEEHRIFFFELVGDTLWGATGAMVRQLVSLGLGIPVALDHA
jgi:8-oxo-dGTP pyrophosphatase MutT (NUDIX family)